MKNTIAMISIIFSMTTFAFAAANSSEAIVTIKGMMCSSCAKKLKTQLMKNPSIAQVSVNYKKGLVDISFKEGQTVTDQEISQTVQATADNEYSVGKIARK